MRSAFFMPVISEAISGNKRLREIYPMRLRGSTPASIIRASSSKLVIMNRSSFMAARM